MSSEELQLISTLIGNVRNAVPKGGSERDVVTYITRPMWQLWCRYLGDPEDCEPTEWLGHPQTRRVYGSKTIIIQGDELLSYSKPRKGNVKRKLEVPAR